MRRVQSLLSIVMLALTTSIEPAGYCAPKSSSAAPKSSPVAPKLSPAAPKTSSSRRTFTFPQQYSVGTIYAVPPDELPGVAHAIPLGPASGVHTITIPSGRLVMFEPNPRGYAHPEFVDALNADCIDVLKVSLLEMVDEKVGLCAKFMQHAARLKKLKCLLIDHSDVTDKMIEVLAPQPELTMLSGDLTNLDGSCFKSFDKFPKLKDIRLTYAPINSRNYTYLATLKDLSNVDLLNAHVDDRALQAICNCSNLYSVAVGGNDITEPGLRSLVKLKKLKYLDLRAIRISSPSAKILKQLKLARLTVSSNLIAAADLKILQKSFQVVCVGKAGAPDEMMRSMFAPLH